MGELRIMKTDIVRLAGRSGILVCAALVLGACGGGNGSGNRNDPNPDPDPDPPPTVVAEFSSIQANVLTPTCATAGCHTGAGAPQGLRLDEANSFALLVDVDSAEVSALKRVEPGNPDDSYLIQKLEGTAAVGERMPLGRAPLEQTVIDAIRQWISDGAIDDRVPSAEPIRVTSLAPAPGDTLDTTPAGIVAMFDRELDVSTVNASTFLLEASGGDGTFGDGNETTVTAAAITTPAMTPMSATYDLTGVPLGDDTYRVRLLGGGPSMILDIDANALDGEFGGTFPSGDGAEGGDFEATWVLDTAPAAITFAEIQTAVFTPSCAFSGCHGGPAPAQGMNLAAGQAFANIVGVPSMEVPALDRVEPGDPDSSYLVQKLEGTAAVGARMPLGRPPIDSDLINDIRQWIADGANP